MGMCDSEPSGDQPSAQSLPAALHNACLHFDLPTRAVCLRRNRNLTFRLLDAPYVARLTPLSGPAERTLNSVRAEYELLIWLATAGFPSLPVEPRFPLFVSHDTVVMVSHYSPGDPTPPNAPFGKLVAQFHQATDGYGKARDLMNWDVIPWLRARLASARPEFAGRLQPLARDLAELERDPPRTTLGWGVVHGDAYPLNVLTDIAGKVRLIDFELAGHGPREWDLVPAWIAHYRMGQGDWPAFVRGYGFDLTKHPDGDKWIRLGKLRAILWLLSNAYLPSAWRDEALLRLRHWQGDDRVWQVPPTQLHGSVS
jgi:Ser/Thr protein kinase RdoA (MazF antagonist)